MSHGSDAENGLIHDHSLKQTEAHRCCFFERMRTHLHGRHILWNSICDDDSYIAEQDGDQFHNENIDNYLQQKFTDVNLCHVVAEHVNQH